MEVYVLQPVTRLGDWSWHCCWCHSASNYFYTNTSSHHHVYDEVNNELTDIENNKIELKKIPIPPKGKSIKNVNVLINIDNDNQKH